MIMIDIDMPDNCDECRFNTEYGFCKAMTDNFCGNTDDRKRPEWCPMKEQEAVEPINSYGTFRCGKCRNIVGYNDGHGRGYQNNFCSNCGQAVKWE